MVLVCRGVLLIPFSSFLLPRYRAKQPIHNFAVDKSSYQPTTRRILLHNVPTHQSTWVVPVERCGFGWWWSFGAVLCGRKIFKSGLTAPPTYNFVRVMTSIPQLVQTTVCRYLEQKKPLRLSIDESSYRRQSCAQIVMFHGRISWRKRNTTCAEKKLFRLVVFSHRPNSLARVSHI